MSKHQLLLHFQVATNGDEGSDDWVNQVTKCGRQDKQTTQAAKTWSERSHHGQKGLKKKRKGFIQHGRVNSVDVRPKGEGPKLLGEREMC